MAEVENKYAKAEITRYDSMPKPTMVRVRKITFIGLGFSSSICSEGDFS
jgi:hypothetical protein